MKPSFLKHFWIDVASLNVQRLRQAVSWILVWYFWLAAAIAIIASFFTGGSVLYVALPLAVIGLVTTTTVMADASALRTRLIVTVAINSTWMFGLYVASDIHNGEYMLEVHMLYFINTSIIIAYVCWRSVLMTTVAALVHHSVLTLIQPELVWPSSSYAWWHLMNHYILGTINCLGGIYIAASLKRFLDHMESARQEAHHRSIHDDLTGLLNRRGLRLAVEKFYQADAPLPDLTLFQIDLDGFKNINDTVGHAAGDRLLVLVGKRLNAIAPPNSIIARIGGDEFVVASPAIDASQQSDFLDGLKNWMQRPHVISKTKLRVGASVGVTHSSISGGNLDGMMVDADIALYEAKKAGKNRAVAFHPRLKEDAQHLVKTAEAVLYGLENDEFEPYFQTQHDTRTGAIAGVEVLARWNHPKRGILGPAVFLDAVQEAGRAAAFDSHIMSKAFDLIQSLENTGVIFPKVSFNISYQRLAEPGLAEFIQGLPNVRAEIAFELVESVYFDTLSDDEVETVNALRNLGIRIEIDDFGTGHASIIALTKLKPDLLKIDRALISPLSSNPEQIKLIKTIVDMAHGLGIEALAEGVETEDTINKLRMLGVNYVQGYAFSKPMNVADLQGFLVRKSA